jgi:hypothetical protein
LLVDGFVRLTAASLLALGGMTLVRTRRRTPRWLVLYVVAAVVLWAVALWTVRSAFPYPRTQEVPSLSIVATAVFIAALAADELIGSDLRRFFRL